MATPTRSLMLPPGLSDSSLTRTCAGTPSPSRCSGIKRRPADRVENALARAQPRGIDFGVKGSRRFIFGAMNPRPHASLRARCFLRETMPYFRRPGRPYSRATVSIGFREKRSRRVFGGLFSKDERSSISAGIPTRAPVWRSARTAGGSSPPATTEPYGSGMPPP